MKKDKRKEKQTNNLEAFRALAQFSQIGITMAASVIVGVFLGKYVDDLLGSSPWFLLIFSLLGACSAIKLVFNYSKPK